MTRTKARKADISHEADSGKPMTPSSTSYASGSGDAKVIDTISMKDVRVYAKDRKKTKLLHEAMTLSSTLLYSESDLSSDPPPTAFSSPAFSTNAPLFLPANREPFSSAFHCSAGLLSSVVW
jgi:hypothetical protein